MSDYFVWESRRKNPGDALIAEFAKTFREHGVNFLVGRRFLDGLPELEVHMGRDGHLPTDDLVIFRHRCLVHSQRLIRVLRDVGVDNIDYYPLRILNEVTNEVYQSHQAANILDVIHCVDRENSDLVYDDENSFNLWYINRLSLIKERLADSLLFRLGERLSTVIVHRYVKEAVEAARITGVVFLPAEGYREYHGYAFNNPRNVIGTHDEDPEGPADAPDEEEADEEGDGSEDDG